LVVEYLHQKEWKPRKVDANLFWPGLALAGFLIYLGINYQVTGNFFTFVEIERTQWYQYVNPLQGLDRAWQWAFTATFPDNITVGSAQIIFAVFGLLMLVMGFLLRFRLSYNVYMLLTWMLSGSTAWWISIPRYVLAMFPTFILLGLLAHKRTLNYVILVVFTAALCFFTVLLAMGFWAF
jgi:hypothetical protein